MQKKMEAQELKEKAADEKEQKRLAKKEAQAEEVAVSSQRKATRAAAAQGDATEPPTLKKEESSSKKLSTRGRPKTDGSKGSITQYLSKKELADRSGGKSVAQAMEEAAEEHNAKPTAFGAQQDLRSENQPKAVTGGIMRGYQLEGLYWLASLYENGLNGILADEMGLGKTIQTISFIAFLREKGISGPFLVVAPLSTLGNWIEEFGKWAPTIPTVLYHGPPSERAEIRDKRLKDQRSAKFPVVCTSYEICMNDRKHLQYFDWKYIIIVSTQNVKVYAKAVG